MYMWNIKPFFEWFKSYGICKYFQICRSKVTRSKLLLGNAHVEDESPTSNGSKVMDKVKVFVTDRGVDR